MGRSVSYPTGATVAYAETPMDAEWCANCSECATDCGCGEDEKHIIDPEVDWGWIKDDLRTRARALFPSLWSVEDWRGHEDQTLARNRLVDFGVSEYCGLMAVWITPRDDLESVGLMAFATNWIANIEDKFLAEFGEYEKIGTFSNGEAIYRKAAA